MIRALVWKEWRSQRPLVLAGLGIAAVLPLFMIAGLTAASGSRGTGYVLDFLAPALLFVVWPLIAAATGANAFAADTGDGSLGFVLSRPVSRARLLGIKVGTAWGAFMAVVVGSLAIVAAYTLLLDAAGGRAVDLELSDLMEPGALVVLLPFALLFGCCLYCSLFVRRPIAAALAGSAVAVGGAAFAFVTWMLVVPASPWIEGTVIGFGALTALPLGTLGILATTLWALRRGDFIAQRSGWAFLLPLGVVALVVVLISTGPAVYFGLQQMTWSYTRMRGAALLVDGAAIYTEPTPSGLSTRIVERDLAGGDSRVIAPKHALLPTVSSDADWVVYISFGSYAGLLANRPLIRAARRDGSEDRLIADLLPGWRSVFNASAGMVAPDGDQVAFAGFDDVLLTSISEGDARIVDLGIDGYTFFNGQRGGVLGWTDGSPTELLFYRRTSRLNRSDDRLGPSGFDDTLDSSVVAGSAMYETELIAYEPLAGEERLIHAFPGAQDLALWRSYLVGDGQPRERALRWLPVWLVEPGGVLRTRAIDVLTGELTDLSASPCRFRGLLVDELLVYGNCSGSLIAGDSRADIRIRNLRDGTDARFAVIEGFDRELWSEALLSPDGERLVIYARRALRAPYGTFVVERDGDARMIGEAMTALEWLSDREVVLAHRGQAVDGSVELLAVDVETGVARVLGAGR